MKSIFALVFAFSLGVLAPLAEETPEFNQADTTFDTASLGSRNLDSLDTQDRFLSRKKRGQINSWTGRRRKVNSSPVCFGARNHQFGRFLMPSSGRLAAIKLVHLYGYVSCRANEANRWSYWGCGGDPLLVAVTTSTNHVLFPPNQFKDNSKEFRIKAYNSWSPELVFSVFSHPHWVSLGQQLRVWYTQDLWYYYETDNGGRACCDVYALYI